MNVTKEEFEQKYLKRDGQDIEAKMVEEFQRLHGIDIREELKNVIDAEYRQFLKCGPGYWKKDESDQT